MAEEWSKQPIHVLGKEVILADGSRLPLKQFVEPPAPPSLDKETIEHNARMLAGKQFSDAATRESVGGTSFVAGYGENRLAVNAAVDSSGKILVFSNAPERPAAHVVTFVVNVGGVFCSSGRLPMYIERITLAKGGQGLLKDEAKLHALVAAARQANKRIAASVKRFQRKQLLLAPFRSARNFFERLRRQP
ncbi:MAG: hypothetical protein AB1626_03960 [Candidatus Micrarchaeota archaeon]